MFKKGDRVLCVVDIDGLFPRYRNVYTVRYCGNSSPRGIHENQLGGKLFLELEELVLQYGYCSYTPEYFIKIDKKWAEVFYE